MKFLIASFTLWFAFSGFAQEKEQYREMASVFMEAYNAGDYDRIFGLFDSVMQEGLSLEKTHDFLGRQVRSAAGKIEKMEFYRLQGTAHIYKSTFEGGLMDVLISLNGDNQLNGLYLKPHLPSDTEGIPLLERNSTPMMLPFTGEWFVFWGGDSESQNYHMANSHQQFAYDLLKVDAGSSYKDDPSKNENYLAFGQKIIAPCDGTVVLAIDGIPDNKPGDLNPIYITGNTLVLETAAKEYILFGHLKEGSIKVKKGQKVFRGEKLAECGNSGNSSEPHLHLQLQNTRDFHKATGARMVFDSIMVNGELKSDYMPVKEDFIQNKIIVN
jgi:hypothetical protein